MASQDNQIIQSTNETVQGSDSTDGTVRNVTGYIHYNKNDDLSKIFNTLHQFRISHGLKYSHHRDFIFFSVKSDCLTQLAKVQPFRISHYRSKSEYSCSKEQAEKLLTVRDSFIRMSWSEEDNVVVFLSRTIGRVHNQLVHRVFKSTSESFVRSNYHFIKNVVHENGEQNKEQHQEAKPENTIVEKKTTRDVTEPYNKRHTGQTGSKTKKRQYQSRGRETTQPSVSSDGFTKVVRNKSKYNKKVQVETNTPRARGSNRKPTSTQSASAPPA